MRLYTFIHAGQSRLGAEYNGCLIDLGAAEQARGGQQAALLADMLTFIRAGEAALHAARVALAFTAEQHTKLDWSYALDDVTLCAPLLNPGKILCSGVNYKSHQQENPGAVLPDTPGFFAKLQNAIIGPGAPIVRPKLTTQLDYEVELAVVVGRRLRKASPNDTQAAVFGYTILHDVSARDIQFKAPQPNQITLGKNFDTFAPIGPCIVTADTLPALDTLRLRTLVNGEVRQDGSTSDWLFPLPQLLAFLSQVMTLEPGDIVTTGTPAGVGVFRTPPVFLQPGDVVRLEIEGIGVLENPVISEQDT